MHLHDGKHVNRIVVGNPFVQQAAGDKSSGREIAFPRVKRFLYFFSPERTLYDSSLAHFVEHTDTDSLQTNRQAGRQTGRQAGRQARTQADRLTDRRTDRQTDRQAGRHAGT